MDTIVNNTRDVGVCIGDVENRDEWRFRTKVADHKWTGKKAKEDEKSFSGITRYK
jgi:hypothetical protein